MKTAIKYDENGLIPAVVQDSRTGTVLMLGYMNRETYEQTLQTGLVTFYSRSRGEVWIKGATSGNYLRLVSLSVDCDNDSLLIQAIPDGPTCHTGATSCFSEVPPTGLSALFDLEKIIGERFETPREGSYIQSLREKGLAKIAQKVGEEGVEVVIEAMRDEPQLFLEESADLLFHYLVLLRAKGFGLKDVLEVLEGRKK